MSEELSIVKAIESISDGMKHIGEPLSESQYMMLAGQMGMWLESAARSTPKQGEADDANSGWAALLRFQRVRAEVAEAKVHELQASRWASSEDPRCKCDGGEACIDCLCIGDCMAAAPSVEPPQAAHQEPGWVRVPVFDEEQTAAALHAIEMIQTEDLCHWSRANDAVVIEALKALIPARKEPKS